VMIEILSLISGLKNTYNKEVNVSPECSVDINQTATTLITKLRKNIIKN